MNKKSDWKERTMTTTMCQMFGDFFNRNFGEFINKSLSHCCQRNRLHSKKYHVFYFCVTKKHSKISYVTAFGYIESFWIIMREFKVAPM